MTSRLGFYRRADNPDEHPLPIHEEENNEIEMHNFGEEGVAEDQFDHQETPIKIVYKKRPQERCYCTWAITTTLLLIVLLGVAIKVHQSIRNVHWCCLNEDEMEKCMHMAFNFEYERFRPIFTCIKASSISECISKIDSDAADVVTIPNSYLYQHRRFLQPIMSENMKKSGFETFLVAIANVNDTDAKLSRDGLRGKRAWLTDVELVSGFLRNTSVISKAPCKQPDALFELFQSNLCVPTSVDYYTACNFSTTAVEKRINESLKNHLFNSSPSKRSVVFVDHVTMSKYINSSQIQNFRLLCPNGTRAELNEYKTCHLMRQPSRALVVSSKIRSGSDIDIPADIVEVLHVAQLYFGSHSSSDFKMFKSVNGTNLLFDDETKLLAPLLVNCTAENYLGADYMRYRSSYDCQTVSTSFQTCLLPQYEP